MFPDSDDLPQEVEGLAERVRGLIGSEDCAAAAQRIGVTELALTASIPGMAVLVAIVQNYGVDPTWLLTGQYNLVTHRQAMEGDRLRVADILRNQMKQQCAPSTERTPGRPDERSRPPPETGPAS